MLLIATQAAAEYMGTVLIGAAQVLGTMSGKFVGFVSTPRGGVLIGVGILVLFLLFGRRRSL